MTKIKHTLTSVVERYKTTELVMAFILFWTPAIIFAKLAGEVLERKPIGADLAILRTIHSWSSPLFDQIFLFFTTIGNVEYVLVAAAIILAYLLYKKQRLNALILLFGVGGAAASNVILKLIFHRDRPAFWHSLVTETGYSFPSGHAMMSSALALCLVVLLWNTKWRLTAIVLGGIVVAMVGISRLYMGVHYPTDIIAGWSVSLAWVLVVAIIAKGWSRRPKGA
jgi:undecaprenyl-diphosphatase